MVEHFTQRNLIQEATYWAPSGQAGETNDFGHPILGNGVLIRCRWEDKVQQIRKANGDEVVSGAEVLVDRDLVAGGYLKLGDFAGQAWESDAHEIQDTRSTPDLRNLGTERRVYL
jgi:hypothetical protein